MRSRKPRSSDGLLNGVYSGSSSKGYRYGYCHARMLLRLAAALLVVAWSFLVYLQGANFFSGGRFSWLSRSDSSGDSSRAKLPQLSADKADKPKHDRKHKHKSQRSKPPDLPVCTPSLLEERQSYPIYGCAEMEVSYGWLARESVVLSAQEGVFLRTEFETIASTTIFRLVRVQLVVLSVSLCRTRSVPCVPPGAPSWMPVDPCCYRLPGSGLWTTRQAVAG